MYMLRYLLLSFLAVTVYFIGISAVFSQIHHQLDIRLVPATHQIKVVDTLRFDKPLNKPLRFSLHSGLSPTLLANTGSLKKIHSKNIYHVYELTLNPVSKNTENMVKLQYQGKIFHALENTSKDYARSFNETSGIISSNGVFLGATSYWYPIFDNELVTFNLNIALPQDWKSVSQGKFEKKSQTDSKTAEKNTIESWVVEKPQQEIYLIAAKFYLYQQNSASVKAQVYLRTSDSGLAQKYLDVTSRYITMYNNLIGKYPYEKFALVENFWETGYGMPSFTLLGSKVIRLPFILHSSYPHEILHNWWGNSVYVDYQSGNWSEGLTSYLADHLIKEQRTQAMFYRRAALQKYTDFVREKQDFPLSDFRSRHSAISEAVGYGKTLMLFHMLRTTIGDKKFKRALKKLYSQQAFKVTGFKDLNRIFKSVVRSPKQRKWIDVMFRQWVQRSGAPQLKLSDYKIIRDKQGFRLTAVLSQVQKEKVFSIEVPIAISLKDTKKSYQTKIRMLARSQKIDLRLPDLPIKLDIDPEFDVFRRLDTNEIPPSINQVFGADKLLIVLPSKASTEMKNAYKSLAKTWQAKQQANIEISYDKDIVNLPKDRAVWLLGWKNLFRDYLNSTLKAYPYNNISKTTFSIENKKLSDSEHSVIIVSRHQIKTNNTFSFAWLATNNVKAVAGLARKLPHYGKYSYLAFSGDEPSNMLKGQWSVVNSPMSVSLAKVSVTAKNKLKTRHPLAMLPAAFSQKRMMQDVKTLSDEKYSGRGLATVEIDKAALYIQTQFQAAGLHAVGNAENEKVSNYFQQWKTSLNDQNKTVKLKNVIAILPGSDPLLKGESLIVAAHYDHLGLGWPDVHQGDEGKIHPGADDNASGVAVMLEVARLLAKSAMPKRTIIFVAFTAEEAGKLGSQYYLEHLTDYPKNKIIAMINLDTVGRLNNKPITVFGNNSAREWVHIFRGVSYVTGISINTVNNDLDSSDHNSFLNVGIPAIQFFSGANLDFHRPSDTNDKIDAIGLIKVATVLKETIDYLANRTEFLTSNLSVSRSTTKKINSTKRRVTLGTVPDFQYSGNGVQIASVTPGSPAAKAKIKKGDILIKINNTEVTNLRDYSNVLRKFQPGDVINIFISRQGIIHELSARVVAR